MTAGPMLCVPLPECTAPGIYVHVPFCQHICSYCDFNTYAGQERLIPAYVDAVVAEIELTARRTPVNGAPTLFFGGGTPSLLTPAQVGRVVAAARALFGLRPDAEITLEANPESLSPETLHGLLEAGVNRLSIGVQSQQRQGLRVLGRGHSAATAAAAFHAARAAGFGNISLDFIFGWPGQTLDAWRADLEAMLHWAPEHVSLYSLIVEPGTPMHDAVRRSILVPPDDDTTADFYECACELLGSAGWEHYEIANWAREPRWRSIHNQLYWQNGPYFGIGAGAYGTVGGTRESNVLRPAAYIEHVGRGELPRALTESIAPDVAAAETMMLGLRLLVDGVGSREFAARHGAELVATYGPTIERFVAAGLLEWHAVERLRLTERGVLLANEVCAAFL